jgi:hypothetical protein
MWGEPGVRVSGLKQDVILCDSSDDGIFVGGDWSHGSGDTEGNEGNLWKVKGKKDHLPVPTQLGKFFRILVSPNAARIASVRIVPWTYLSSIVYRRLQHISMNLVLRPISLA